MSNKTRPLTILVGVALAISGCGSADSDLSTETIGAPVIDSKAADQASSAGGLAAAVELDGVRYLISCVAISPSSLATPLGLADYLGNDVPVRALAGVSTDNAVAIEVDGGACSAGDTQLSDWSLATAQNLDGDQAQQIACDSGLKVEGC